MFPIAKPHSPEQGEFWGMRLKMIHDQITLMPKLGLGLVTPEPPGDHVKKMYIRYYP